MLRVNYAMCRKQAHFAECRYAECHYTECHCAECCYADRHYAECCYAECRGTQPLNCQLTHPSRCY